MLFNWIRFGLELEFVFFVRNVCLVFIYLTLIYLKINFAKDSVNFQIYFWKTFFYIFLCDYSLFDMNFRKISAKIYCKKLIFELIDWFEIQILFFFWTTFSLNYKLLICISNSELSIGRQLEPKIVCRKWFSKHRLRFVSYDICQNDNILNVLIHFFFFFSIDTKLVRKYTSKYKSTKNCDFISNSMIYLRFF